MASISQLIKGHELFWVDAQANVMDVVVAMVQRNIGAVPVLRNGQLVGIFSERDLMKRVFVEHRDPAETAVSEVMTTEPFVVAPDTSLEQCMVIMKTRGFRHLPICDGDKLRGLISLRDILLHEVDEKDDDLKMMQAYIRTGTS
jgi:CBS domain-containing protein